MPPTMEELRADEIHLLAHSEKNTGTAGGFGEGEGDPDPEEP